jgi:LPS O-antigen subunit length determinant protein (WzzB/FepE family)
MRISYQIICDFWSQNKKILISWQVVFLLLAGIYLAITPKTYEAYFQVKTAKILVDGNWSVLKLGRNTRRDLMSPPGFPGGLVKSCMGDDNHGLRRSFVNSIQIDIIDDFGGVMGIAVRLVGIEQARDCANLLAQYIVDGSDAALNKRLADDGFVAGEIQKGKVQAFEKPAVTSQIQMSDEYVKPRSTNILILAFLLGTMCAIAYAILRRRYRAQ